jgi:hypothetical protein
MHVARHALRYLLDFPFELVLECPLLPVPEHLASGHRARSKAKN